MSFIGSILGSSAAEPIDWDNLIRMRYFAGLVVGIAKMLKKDGVISNDIRWGGDWDMDTETKDNKFNDLVHFELI